MELMKILGRKRYGRFKNKRRAEIEKNCEEDSRYF